MPDQVSINSPCLAFSRFQALIGGFGLGETNELGLFAQHGLLAKRTLSDVVPLDVKRVGRVRQYPRNPDGQDQA